NVQRLGSRPTYFGQTQLGDKTLVRGASSVTFRSRIFVLLALQCRRDTVVVWRTESAPTNSVYFSSTGRRVLDTVIASHLHSSVMAGKLPGLLFRWEYSWDHLLFACYFWVTILVLF